MSSAKKKAPTASTTSQASKRMQMYDALDAWAKRLRRVPEEMYMNKDDYDKSIVYGSGPRALGHGERGSKFCTMRVDPMLDPGCTSVVPLTP